MTRSEASTLSSAGKRPTPYTLLVSGCGICYGQLKLENCRYSRQLRWIIAITMFHITHPRTTEWVNSLPLLRHINNVQQQQAAFSMDFRQTVDDMAHLKRSLLLP